MKSFGKKHIKTIVAVAVSGDNEKKSVEEMWKLKNEEKINVMVMIMMMMLGKKVNCN
jgi:hypothetical protein